MKCFITFGLLFALVFAASAVPASKEQLDEVAEGTQDEVKRQERQLYEGAETYAVPSYAAPAQGYAAPAQGYAAPAQGYAAPAKSGKAPVAAPAQVYAPQAYAGPAPAVYSYQAPAPTVPCAKNVVVSCAPSVVPVPCSAPAAPAYAPATGYAW